MDAQPTEPVGDEMVTIKKSYLDALIAAVNAAQEHEDIKHQFWPKEKAMLLALKALKNLQP